MFDKFLTPPWLIFKKIATYFKSKLQQKFHCFMQFGCKKGNKYLVTIFNRQLASLSVVSLSAGGSQSIVYLLEDTTFYMRLRKQDGSQQDV